MSTGEPLFLTRSQVEHLHDQSLARFGGSAGIRDEGLIDSALASAKNSFFYGNSDLYDTAATYAFHLAESQAFLDGNKRTAIGCAMIFLLSNGVKRLPDDNALYNAMIDIANKKLTKAGLAALFRKAAREQD